MARFHRASATGCIAIFPQSLAIAIDIRVNIRIAIAALIVALSVVGCAQVSSLPPRASVTEIEPSGHSAKPPDCDMPVLRADPTRPFRKVAIVEALGNVFANEDTVMPVVKGKACETGADAIVVNTSKSQTGEDMTGYYINAVAIVYGKRAQSPAASIH